MNTTAQKPDSFARVTNVVIELLEKGIIPWKMPWTDKGLPINLWSCKPYRSINLWLLNALEYQENIFLTAQQAEKLGGGVRPDEKPHLAVYWKWREPENGELVLGTEKTVPSLQCYYLFNLAQCKGISKDFIPVRVVKKQNPIDRCNEVIASTPNAPAIRHRGDIVQYQPLFDFIDIPSPESFINDEHYYSSLFKQLMYSTGHPSRLNRKPYQTDEPKVAAHLLEELTAELGACYLCSHCGIDAWNFENRMEYTQGWIEKFKGDSQCIVYAGLQARKAVEYILGESQLDAEDWKIEIGHLQAEMHE